VSDASIDGTARWNQAGDLASARLTVHIVGATAVRVSASWRPFAAQDQPAIISGWQGARRLSATVPAP
jgi:hypothetical protein